MLESPALRPEVAAPGDVRVEVVLGDLGAEPAAGFAVVLGKEEGESAEGLVDEGVWEERLTEAERWAVSVLPTRSCCCVMVIQERGKGESSYRCWKQRKPTWWKMDTVWSSSERRR